MCYLFLLANVKRGIVSIITLLRPACEHKLAMAASRANTHTFGTHTHTLVEQGAAEGV